MRILIKLATLGALTLTAPLALAQYAQSAIDQAPAVTAATDPDANSGEAPNNDIAKKKGDLSDKLNSTNGVIHPEGDEDPGMAKPAPAVGDKTVIPPPGSPNWKPETQPK